MAAAFSRSRASALARSSLTRGEFTDDALFLAQRLVELARGDRDVWFARADAVRVGASRSGWRLFAAVGSISVDEGCPEMRDPSSHSAAGRLISTTYCALAHRKDTKMLHARRQGLLRQRRVRDRTAGCGAVHGGPERFCARPEGETTTRVPPRREAHVGLGEHQHSSKTRVRMGA